MQERGSPVAALGADDLPSGPGLELVMERPNGLSVVTADRPLAFRLVRAPAVQHARDEALVLDVDAIAEGLGVGMRGGEGAQDLHVAEAEV